MNLLVSLLFILPIAATGQTVTDYIHAMEKIQKFYNAGRGDSINALNKHDSDQIKEKEIESFWSNKKVASYLDEFGTLKSFKFIGIDTLDPEKVYVFQTFYSKAGQRITSLTIDKDHNLGTFRFVTTSDGITALLNKRKKTK